MDPNITWSQLLDAYRAEDWHEVRPLAKALRGWLDAGGFPPRITGDAGSAALDNVLAHAACQFFLLSRSMKGDADAC